MKLSDEEISEFLEKFEREIESGRTPCTHDAYKRAFTELQALRKLMPFVRHDELCDTIRYRRNPPRCTCGLDALREEVE